MSSIRQRLQDIREDHARRCATLPWSELEAEASRQGCSEADIFFDRAGRASERLASLAGPAGDNTAVLRPAKPSD